MRLLAGLPIANFTQSTPSTTWTIEHNFGQPPNVEVTLVSGEKILPLRVYHDLAFNTTTITFSIARAGTARVVGLVPSFTPGDSP